MAFLLHQLLDSATARFPGRQALTFAGQRLNYEELTDHSNRLARLLIEQGVEPGDRVGIYMEKSLEAVVAVYGILKAGATYVPIDPFAPSSRIAFIIHDGGIRHLFAKKTKTAQLRSVLERKTSLECLIGFRPQEGIPVRSVPWEEVYRTPSMTVQPANVTELDLAYILYTSGSTGQPKGVMHTHRSALSFVQWAVEAFSLRSEDRLSNHAPFHFDLTIFDLFAAAAVGASTVIIPEDVARLPASLAGLISEESITVWYSVPYALIQLLQRGGLGSRDLTSLRCVLFAGEPFPTKHLQPLMQRLPRASFFNLYGPTETNVCTFYEVPPLPENSEAPIPIGRACANIELTVVNSNDQPVAAGEVGELLVRGPSVMPGYWKRPELTHKAFFRYCNFPPYEQIFYRTGDLVQFGPDGNYHFLGRKDRQVKVRGFRIELDEIELALLSHHQVQEAAVYLVPDHEGHGHIEATVVAKAGTSLTSPQLTGFLSERLPSYAIPDQIVITHQLPRTSTGKIDRRQLQDGAVSARRRGLN